MTAVVLGHEGATNSVVAISPIIFGVRHGLEFVGKWNTALDAYIEKEQDRQVTKGRLSARSGSLL